MPTVLTTVQLEIIMHLANGLRTGEIAVATNWSEAVVKKKIGQARRDMSAKTVPQLVALVIADGLIVYEPEQRTHQTAS
jgi:DNA-binding CsgD family transcriptional regulator